MVGEGWAREGWGGKDTGGKEGDDRPRYKCI